MLLVDRALLESFVYVNTALLVLLEDIALLDMMLMVPFWLPHVDEALEESCLEV